MEQPNPHSSRTGLIIGGGLAAVLVCCLCVMVMGVCGAGFFLYRQGGISTPRPRPTHGAWLERTPGALVTPVVATPQALHVQPSLGLRREAVPAEAIETLRLLESADIPQRDLIDVTQRLSDPSAPIPLVARDTPWDFAVGDTHSFWVSNEDTRDNFQVTARLAYKTDHTYFFVEEGVNLNQDKLKRMADRFESQTYPTDRQFFGSEWTPGVDSDPHLTVLIAGNLGEYVAGYYNSMDEFSSLVHKYSNEMEMFYINADGVRLDSSFYDCVLAHEFQHQIHWANDRNESNWINEGFSELACQLNGFDPGGNEYAFAESPDTQLNSWPDETGQAAPNYGASYMFMAYFLDRFGDEATRALVANPENSSTSVDEVFKALGTNLTFDDVFADWQAANYINNPSMADGRYGYVSIIAPSIEPESVIKRRDLPVELQSDVRQYAGDYIALNGKGEFRIEFAGATVVGLAPIEAHSGKYLWWGGRENNSDTSLTREFDLSGLNKATLTFWTWYDIEADYDYVYVEVSNDGQHWTTLPGSNTTNEDPNGTNYGNGYTDASGGWIQEGIDLSPYAGQKVQVRFEYLTDAGVTHAGIFLDDIEVPELNYRHDAEEDDGGWLARGFIRHANVLPQKWSLQLVTQRHDQTSVERLPLADDNTGSWTVSLDSDEDAALIIAGLTRVTTEPAEYWYAIKANE